jgi:VWFA-related protein
LILCGCATISAFAQNPPPTAAQKAPAPATVPIPDPTRPEIQPNLAVDRDPILSPDPDVPPPTNADTTTAPPKPGEVQKRKDGIYTMHEDVDEVLLNCTVIDEKGRTVMDLTRDDFRVFEDGVPQTVRSFLHQDLPVSLGVLVDNSGSMRDKRPTVNAAALDLIKASNPQDVAFVVNFSDRAYLDQAFTSDIHLLGRGLAHYDARGTTALYDAVAASADELSHHAKHPKQALLVITDGADNASRLNLEQAVRRVQNLGGPVVYTIGLLFDADKVEAQRTHEALELLSSETGGVAYFPHSLEDVDRIALEVAADIRNQYTVGYQSTKATSKGGYRTVHVEAKAPGHGKLTVRTKRGYFATNAPPKPTQTAQETKP